MKKSAVVKESKESENKSKTKKVLTPNKKIEDASKPITKENKNNKVKTIEPVKKINPKVSVVKEVPVPEQIKNSKPSIDTKKEVAPIKEKLKPEPTIADRMLNSVMFLFFIGLVLWILSSIALRTTEVQIAVKAQIVEREIQEIERSIDGLNIEIFELKSKDRLMEIAEELGLQYAWDRIKVIQE